MGVLGFVIVRRADLAKQAGLFHWADLHPVCMKDGSHGATCSIRQFCAVVLSSKQ